MHMPKRKTLVLDDDLLQRARHRAAESGSTLGDVVNEALRELLDRPMPAARPLRLVAFGGPPDGSSLEPAELAAALEEDDRRRLR